MVSAVFKTVAGRPASSRVGSTPMRSRHHQGSSLTTRATWPGKSMFSNPCKGQVLHCASWRRSDSMPESVAARRKRAVGSGQRAVKTKKKGGRSNQSRLPSFLTAHCLLPAAHFFLFSRLACEYGLVYSLRVADDDEADVTHVFLGDALHVGR